MLQAFNQLLPLPKSAVKQTLSLCCFVLSIEYENLSQCALQG